MTTMSISVEVPARGHRPARVLAAVRSRLRAWRIPARDARALARWHERELRDIGLSRVDADEADRLFLRN